MARRRKPGGNGSEYRERKYRDLILDRDLVSFQVRVKETDLYIRAERDLRGSAHASILRHRFLLEQYILRNPEFVHSLAPVEEDEFAPAVAGRMIRAARRAGVGPMAAVAGAMADAVGEDLLAESHELVVENGGDIFLKSSREVKVAIFAGSSPLSLRMGLRIPGAAHPWGVCTSSGTVGPSLSFGRADAVCVVAPSAALADAAATAVGNLVRSRSDLEKALEKAGGLEGITGVVIILGETLAAWGNVELVEMKEAR